MGGLKGFEAAEGEATCEMDARGPVGTALADCETDGDGGGAKRDVVADQPPRPPRAPKPPLRGGGT